MERPQGLSIEEMRPVDLKEVMEIEIESFKTPWPRELFEKQLSVSSRISYVVAKLGGEIIGYGGAAQEGDVAHLTTIAVKEGFRRRGVGSAILSRLFELSKERGITSVTLELRRSNLAAFRFYTKLGFAPRFILGDYYADDDEDAIVMAAAIDKLNLKGRVTSL